MIDIIRAAAGIFAALAPFALIPAYTSLNDGASSEDRRPRTDLALSTAFAVFVVAVLLTDPFLGFLDVSPENFQGAAAVIMLPLAARLLWTGRTLDRGERLTRWPWLMPLAVPGLVGPATLAAVVAYAGRFGEGEAVAATGIAITATAAILLAAGLIQRLLGDVALNVLGRLSGAFIVVIAMELAVNGVRSV